MGFMEKLTVHGVQARAKAAAASLSNIDFVTADAESANFEEAAFDCVLCSSGMLYMQDIGAAVQRFHRWLKPGGALHFNTPQVRLTQTKLQC